MAAQSDIDRLIELGLNAYGAGDIDGALLVWEQVLLVDPDNAQANSYVDYVRLNYDMLVNAEPELVREEGYAISEDPEYQIEIELPPAEETPKLPDPIDQGWFMEEKTHDATSIARTRSHRNSEEVTIDASARDEELTHDASGPLLRRRRNTGEDEATREYRPDFAAEVETNEFEEHTPVGFAQQETEIRKRDLGFVQPVTNEKPSSPISIGTASTVELATSGLPLPADPKRTTQDMPSAARTPGRRESDALSQAEVMLPHAPTQDFELSRPVDIGAPTRELGLRALQQQTQYDDEALTKESDVRAIRDAAARADGNAQPVSEKTRHDLVISFDPIEARTRDILEEVDEEAPADEPKEEQTRRRITSLLQKANAYIEAQETDKAVAAADLALSEDPNSALGQKLIARNKDLIMQIFQSYIGDLERMPQLAKPLHELQNAPINPRAAFLLSRIDGTLTVDELLDVSGMPRLEAYRHLCQLLLRGILR